MDPKQIAKQMIIFNKPAFDNNFHAMQACMIKRRIL